jgi:hypothetical protein
MQKHLFKHKKWKMSQKISILLDISLKNDYFPKKLHQNHSN